MIPRNTKADQKIFRADSFDLLEINIGPRIDGCIRIIAVRYGNVSKNKDQSVRNSVRFMYVLLDLV